MTTFLTFQQFQFRRDPSSPIPLVHINPNDVTVIEESERDISTGETQKIAIIRMRDFHIYTVLDLDRDASLKSHVAQLIKNFVSDNPSEVDLIVDP